MWTSILKTEVCEEPRLRASLGQELLEAILVCSTETDLSRARSIPNERIHENCIADQSTENASASVLGTVGGDSHDSKLYAVYCL